MKNARHYASAAVGLAITIGFLALAARNVDGRKLWAILSHARPGWVLLMSLVSFADLVIRARRWRLLLSRPPAAKPAFSLLYRLEAIGLAMNNVLFMRLGEVARAFLAGRELKIPVATALASVAVERALDVSALLALFCAAAWGLPGLVEPAFLRGALSVLGAALVAIGVLAFLEERLAAGHAWERWLRAFPKLHTLVSQLAAGASVLRRPSAALEAAALSLGLWAIDALAYWTGARALGLGEFVDYPRSILVLSWAGAASAIPTAPGGFGSFELAVQTVAGRFGIEPQAALGYALFNHMVGYIVVTLLGLVFLYKTGLSLAELKGALEREGKR